jgi:hypothetical protein
MLGMVSGLLVTATGHQLVRAIFDLLAVRCELLEGCRQRVCWSIVNPIGSVTDCGQANYSAEQ